MKALVIGCGKFGLNIAIEMDRAGHEVSIVDCSYKSFEQLPDSFSGKRINGDALVRDVLDRAHVETADAVVLTPTDDALNLSLARMFQDKFKKSNIIALNTKPEYRLYYDKLGIQTVSMISWGVLRIEELLTNNLRKSAYCLGTTEVGVYNVVVPDNGVTISAEALQKISQCLIFALTHQDITVNFTNELVVVPGDILHVSTNTEGLRNLYMSLGMKTKEVMK
jgi:trk system potassium uptake protein TrkA